MKHKGGCSLQTSPEIRTPVQTPKLGREAAESRLPTHKGEGPRGSRPGARPAPKPAQAQFRKVALWACPRGGAGGGGTQKPHCLWAPEEAA